MTAAVQRLADEGFAVELRGAHILVHDIPYVTGQRTVARGTLAFVIEPAAGSGSNVIDHRAMWTGEVPCDGNGLELSRIHLEARHIDLGGGVIVRHMFSSKPPCGFYLDQREQAATYASIIANEARAIDSTATMLTRRMVVPATDGSPFVYVDNATARAGIDAVSRKLELGSIVIVGLGGTGSYVLDLIAKTPVRRILTIDGDVMEQHNAYRAPGAVSIEDLRSRPFKVDYWKSVYSRMHRGIEAFPVYLDASTAHLLDGVDFVFLCMDPGPGKRLAVERLEAGAVPFIDCGMGLEHVEDRNSILGLIRVTTSVPGRRAQARRRLGLEVGAKDDLYARNIQVADLNALNAALAVVRFKRHFGFYLDLEHEHQATYCVDSNRILNEDRTPPNAANATDDPLDGEAAA